MANTETKISIFVEIQSRIQSRMESNCNNLEVEELNTRTGTLSREHQPSFPVATLTGSAIHQQVLSGWGWGGWGGEEL